jgi:hypothetical protein
VVALDGPSRIAARTVCGRISTPRLSRRWWIRGSSSVIRNYGAIASNGVAYVTAWPSAASSSATEAAM